MVLSTTDIEAKDGKLLRFADVPAYIHKLSGVRPRKWTIYGWHKKGKKAYCGRMIKLRAIRSCGLYLTTERWIENFLRKLNT